VNIGSLFANCLSSVVNSALTLFPFLHSEGGLQPVRCLQRLCHDRRSDDVIPTVDRNVTQSLCPVTTAA